MNKFNESLNTAVFTTTYVLEQHSPILYVYHYDDGSWQFSGKESGLKDEDYKIISLGEMLVMDKSLEELGDMPLGFEAVRETEESKWKIISGN